MFSPLPTSMPKLEEAVRQLDEVALQSPPPMLEIGVYACPINDRDLQIMKTLVKVKFENYPMHTG
jgi:hypothetical protein